VKDLDDFASWLRALTPAEIEKGNRLERKRVKAEFTHFEQSHAKGKCYLCHRPYGSFEEATPCLHWLLRPKGFKKRHFPAVYAKWGFHRMSAYLRWLANSERLFGNINDLPEEHREGAVFGLAINYLQFEWRFLCLPSDHAGHGGASAGAAPHYHFRMTDEGRPFIDYNDFHVPLQDDDLWKLEMKRRYPDVLVEQFTHGAGMNTLLSAMPESSLLDLAQPATSQAEGTTQIDTIIQAAPGESFTGEEVEAIVREAREKNVTVASLAHKLGHATTIIVQPGEAVPQPADRTRTR
jgi:hypothetical protein